MKRFLFLDFDGVLNNVAWLCSPRSTSEFDPENMQWLNLLMCRVEPQIVISSSWRSGRTVEDLQILLAESHFWFPNRIIDKTPEDRARLKNRGEEIAFWMRRHRVKAPQVVILDDDHDMGDLRPRLIQTDFRTGLRPENVRAALRLWR